MTETMIDPITATVIQGAMDNIAVEMGYKLMRMSYSSIIRESEDFGAALTDMIGRQLCECRISTPLQSGPIPGYVRNILKTVRERGETIEPGDVFMHNDPYGGASHGPDVAFCVPIFFENDLVGFSTTTAHHLDIGAMTPGSSGIVDAVDTYAEGLQFKAIKVYDRFQKVEPVWHILRSNIRIPDLVVGDMEAQISAARIGAERFVDLMDSYGREVVEAAYENMMSYSERIMREAIRIIPDGEYAATGIFEGFVETGDPEKMHLPICAKVIVKEDSIIVDLTGTANQVSDRPINMPFEGTVDCAIWLTLRSILLDSVDFGIVPQNDGLTRPITVVAPRGSLANPEFPAPVISRFCPGNVLADPVMRALSAALPERVSAGVGNLRIMSMSGRREGQQWVHMEILEGAYGGRHGLDGMDAVDTLYANTRNNPIEDIETHIPVRVDQYELRDDAMVPGRWRGGIGSQRVFTFLQDSGFSLEGDGHEHAPWGFGGGRDGRTSSLEFRQADGNSRSLTSKVPYTHVRVGDQLIIRGPCGGGYGNPMERLPEAVLADCLDGLIDENEAEALFGVIIRGGRIDRMATEAKRATGAS